MVKRTTNGNFTGSWPWELETLIDMHKAKPRFSTLPQRDDCIQIPTLDHPQAGDDGN